MGKLLAVQCSAIGVIQKKSNISHSDGGRGLFVVQPVGNGSIVGYFYCSVVFEDLVNGDFCVNTHDKRVTKMKGATFLKWEKRLQEWATDREMVQHPL